jgi:hypothetical protein
VIFYLAGFILSGMGSSWAGTLSGSTVYWGGTKTFPQASVVATTVGFCSPPNYVGKRWYTVSDDKGKYLLALPPGEYKLFVRVPRDGLPQYNYPDEVMISANTNATINLEVPTVDCEAKEWSAADFDKFGYAMGGYPAGADYYHHKTAYWRDGTPTLALPWGWTGCSFHADGWATQVAQCWMRCSKETNSLHLLGHLPNNATEYEWARCRFPEGLNTWQVERDPDNGNIVAAQHENYYGDSAAQIFRYTWALRPLQGQPPGVSFQQYYINNRGQVDTQTLAAPPLYKTLPLTLPEGFPQW